MLGGGLLLDQAVLSSSHSAAGVICRLFSTSSVSVRCNRAGSFHWMPVAGATDSVRCRFARDDSARGCGRFAEQVKAQYVTRSGGHQPVYPAFRFVLFGF